MISLIKVVIPQPIQLHTWNTTTGNQTLFLKYNLSKSHYVNYSFYAYKVIWDHQQSTSTYTFQLIIHVSKAIPDILHYTHLNITYLVTCNIPLFIKLSFFLNDSIFIFQDIITILPAQKTCYWPSTLKWSLHVFRDSNSLYSHAMAKIHCWLKTRTISYSSVWSPYFVLMHKHSNVC